MIFQPSPGCPSTLVGGTTAPSAKISVVPVARLAIVGSLRMSRPGVSLGTSSTVRPLCLAAALSLRVSMAMTVLRAAAPEHHSFWPVIFQPSGVSSERVRVLAASDPADGSEMEIEKRISPFMNAGRKRSCCSFVPNLQMFMAVKVDTMKAVAKSKP